MEDGSQVVTLSGFASSAPLPFLVAAGFLRTPFCVCPSIEHSGSSFINVQKRKSQPPALSFQSFCH